MSNATLLAQRRAVAAAPVSRGAGDLDLTLILVHGSFHGRVDLALAAHEDPVGMWAEAVWCKWLPRVVLCRLADYVVRMLMVVSSPWAQVTGPAGAFVASAQHLSWVVSDALPVRSDRGVQLNFSRDSPAFVQHEVRKSVWRWRWRGVEERITALQTAAGGFGVHFFPLFRLLQAKPCEAWVPREKAVNAGQAAPIRQSADQKPLPLRRTRVLYRGGFPA